MPLTTEQKKDRLMRIAKVLDGGNSALIKEIFALEERIAELKKIAKGEPGEPGKNGKDYILTKKDKAEIAGKITVPIVEKVIERTETIKEQPVHYETIKEYKSDDKEIIENIEKDLPKLGESIRDGLELLEGDDRLDKKAIKGLEELENRINLTGKSGGVSNARIIQAFKYILKTESPVGDIDGVNTQYTVSQPIFAVLAFSLNGEVIPQLPNYTIMDRTITFSAAIPAVYSGKDFEIKYI